MTKQDIKKLIKLQNEMETEEKKYRELRDEMQKTVYRYQAETYCKCAEMVRKLILEVRR